jgi:hypothetical protein
LDYALDNGLIATAATSTRTVASIGVSFAENVSGVG